MLLMESFMRPNGAILIIDPISDRVVDANPKACIALGYSKGELISLAWSAVHPHHSSDLAGFAPSPERNGFGWPSELACLTKSGELLCADITASFVEEKGSTHLVAVIRPATKDAHSVRIIELTESLKDCEQPPRAVFENAVDGILIMDECGDIQAINPAAEVIFGHSAVEILGKCIRQMVPGLYLHNHERHLGRLLETGQTRMVGIWQEFNGVHKYGSVVRIELLVTEVALGQSRLFACLLHEISVPEPPGEGNCQPADEEERDRSAREFLVGLTRSLAQAESLTGHAVGNTANGPAADSASLAGSKIAKRPAVGAFKHVWRSVWALLRESPESAGTLEPALVKAEGDATNEEVGQGVTVLFQGGEAEKDMKTKSNQPTSHTFRISG